MAPPQGEPQQAREALSEVAADATQVIPETTVGSISPISDPPAQQPSVPGPDREAEEADRAADGLTGLTELISRELADQNRASGPAAAPQAADGEIVSSEPETAEPGRTYGSANTDARLVLKASAPVWVRIEDKQGNVVMTQTLLAGDSYRVPNRPDLVIIARDGGLLTFEIDGVPKGSLGAPGEILVGRSLDLERLAKQG
jgi:cytoskeleton protein RodZ